jgi:hypothetical protein
MGSRYANKQTARSDAREQREEQGDESPSVLHPSVVTVTPELAAKWLERNHTQNRPINWKRVEAMANDMRTPGAWKLTHQAIAFDGEGDLIDGQHRLQAVVQAGKPVQMLVVRNDEGSFHDPIDRGAARSIGLLMGKHGRTVTAINALRMLEQGCYMQVPMTLSEAETIYHHHAESIEKILKTVSSSHKLVGPVVAACAWAMPCGHDQSVLRFAQQVTTGEMIARGDPAFAFRTWANGNSRAPVWQKCMAALNCVRYALYGMKMARVFTGESGYRAITSQRRLHRTGHTPGTDLVPSLSGKPQPDNEEK